MADRGSVVAHDRRLLLAALQQAGRRRDVPAHARRRQGRAQRCDRGRTRSVPDRSPTGDRRRGSRRRCPRHLHQDRPAATSVRLPQRRPLLGLLHADVEPRWRRVPRNPRRSWHDALLRAVHRCERRPTCGVARRTARPRAARRAVVRPGDREVHQPSRARACAVVQRGRRATRRAATARSSSGHTTTHLGRPQSRTRAGSRRYSRKLTTGPRFRELVDPTTSSSSRPPGT